MSMDDFLDLMERQLMSTLKTEEDLEKNFRKLLQDSFYWFDKDRDGVLNKKELECAFSLIGESLQDGEFEDFFGDCDRNGDGKIDYEEWVKLMLELEGEIKC
jgi:calmodulin